MLTLRMIGKNDYRVSEDAQRIGRIRYASERTPGVWHWHVQLHIPGPPFGEARGHRLGPRRASKTNHLQIITFGLRTAGPYRYARSRHRVLPSVTNAILTASLRVMLEYRPRILPPSAGR